MTLRIKQLLAPPAFADEEQARIGRILHTVLWAFLVASSGVSVWGISVASFTLVWALGGAALIFAGSLWQIRRGRLGEVSILVIATLLVMTVFLIYTGNGIHDNFIIVYPGTLILGSLVLNQRNFLVLVILTILSVGGIVFGEMWGIIQTPYSAETSFDDFLGVGAALLVTAVSVRILANDLTTSLRQARLAQHALAKNQADLQTYILELEKKQVAQAQFANQLHTAAEVTQQLTLILDPEELLNQIVTLLQNRFNLYHVQVYLLDKTTNHLIIKTASGKVGRTLREQGHYIELMRPNSLVARTAREKTIIVVNDVSQEPSFLPNPLLPATRAEVSLPLLIQEHILGVLDIQTARPESFPTSTLNTFHILAGQIAIALENARLFSQLAESEANLREGESRYRSLFEDSPISLWETDFSLVRQALNQLERPKEQSWRFYFSQHPETVIPCIQQLKVMDVNQVTLTMFQAADKEALFSLMPKFFNEKILDFLREQLIALANGLISFTGEVILRRLDGGKINVIYRLVIAPGYEETWKKAFVSLIDITERKRVEQALQAERDFAQQVIENMGQGLTVTDGNGRFQFVNSAYSRMLGYSVETLLQKSPYDLVIPDDIETLSQSQQKRRAGQSSSYEAALVHADGHLVDVLITGVPRWEGNKINGSIAVITDLTERKRAEQERERLITELEARNAELGRFTYTVSHDLKSPLVTIKGFLGLLAKDIARGDSARIKSDMERIQTAAITMEALLNDLLELARVGQLENTPQEAPFNQLAQEAVERVMGQIAERGVEVTINPKLPIIYGDLPRLVEVVQNLVDNAVKFMGTQPNPQIEIGAREFNGETAFYVKDNGIGIEPRFHEKIFGLFDRLDQSIDGTGIGLALVKRIIEVHNGRIWVESEGANKGSTFFFTVKGNTT